MSHLPHHLAAPPETVDDDPLVTATMTTRLVAVTPDTPASTALLLMARRGVRHLPVLDGPACVGLVLETDLLRCLAQISPLVAAASIAVSDLARPVTLLPATARRSDAARRMVVDSCDAVLVFDDDRLLGIVTAADLVRSLAAGSPPQKPPPRSQ